MNQDDRVVLGIGNPFLQDDRAGLAVIEALETDPLCRLEALHTVGFELMDKVRGCAQAIVVDACMLGGAPGEIRELRLDDIFQSHQLSGSHAITIASTLKTGYICFPDEMPADLRIILIEVKNVKEFTTEMSPEVVAAVVAVTARIRALLAA
ncbi:MAG: hydrogenase maturation protease [Desulfobulbaceae bacterium]|jgi:hydrogenase maturation protease|nr:hydrogenase maturation protease [Desulfobulbaceae bacterium]